jgi:hypothetical protein
VYIGLCADNCMALYEVELSVALEMEEEERLLALKEQEQERKHAPSHHLSIKKRGRSPS